MNRRELIKGGGAIIALAAPAAVQAGPQGDATTASRIANRHFRLDVRGGNGLTCRLEHGPTGTLLADGDYHYSFATPAMAVLVEDDTIICRGHTAAGLLIEHRFSIASGQPWIEERITIRNESEAPLDLGEARCGFVFPQPVRSDAAHAIEFAAIPFYHETAAAAKDQYVRFSDKQIVNEPFISGLWETLSPTEHESYTSHYASEGWIWRIGETQFLLTKYNPEAMEWSILNGVTQYQAPAKICWGGFGFHHRNPEHGMRLKPGESFTFGTSRLTATGKRLNDGFYAFREEMAARGHGTPKGYDPPVRWNELFDNKLWSLPPSQQNDPARKRELYTLADMKIEAAKAKAYGCEALHLDPGWDTSFGSKIWDESRLGSFEAFVRMLSDDYGLKCALHTPMSGWCDWATYSKDTYRKGGRSALEGVQNGLLYYGTPICGASRQYTDETLRRLRTLARQGAVFFMFDGTNYYDTNCWDPDHGHALPARGEEHAAALMQMSRTLRDEFPGLLIEMHDPIAGGWSRYAPIYYGHQNALSRGKSPNFDSVWAFELMWDPMANLVLGQSLVLYYYNLAYALPLCVHIDLRTDNEQAIVFWWNASTCRHFGIGGTHSNPDVAKAHTAAMQEYRRLKRYFTQGPFYGIDEACHVHSDPDTGSAVVNVFNLTRETQIREVRIDPGEIGLSADRRYRFQGATFRRAADAYVAQVTLPPLGHKLIEMGAPPRGSRG